MIYDFDSSKDQGFRLRLVRNSESGGVSRQYARAAPIGVARYIRRARAPQGGRRDQRARHVDRRVVESYLTLRGFKG